MPHNQFDHLVVAAETLEQGMAYVTDRLGVPCRPGGQHPAMGTHNALLRLGDKRYLEVIAINPAAGPITAARWFGLDDPERQARLSQHGPTLLTWVARTDDLDAAMAACRHDPGRARSIQRGDLHWRVAFAEDGRLVSGGLVPALMQWGAGTRHPGEGLPEQHMELLALHATHPDPENVHTTLVALGLENALTLTYGPSPRLEAEIETRGGRVRLG